MIKYNGKLYIIGVDMGYGNMKTASCHFPTGIEKYDSKPGFAGDFLELDGNYYKIGEGHKFFIADKTLDNEYYILTLAQLPLPRRPLTVLPRRIGAVAAVSWRTSFLPPPALPRL